MPFTLSRRTLVLSTAALALPSMSLAATHEVQMLNKNPDDPKQRMVFYPRIQVVQPGDTITFVPADKGHNSESFKGMIPEGAEAWKGKISKEVSVTFEVPGFYGFKCTPHQSVGMVGLVVVQGDGMMNNLEAAQGVRQRGKAKAVFAEIWEQAAADGLLS